MVADPIVADPIVADPIVVEESTLVELSMAFWYKARLPMSQCYEAFGPTL